MSALNICMKRDRCIILQDAAVYREDGEIIEFVEKGVVVEGKGVFVAATGPKAAVHAFAELVSRTYADIDDIGDTGEPGLGIFVEEMAGALGDFCVAFVGWSGKLDRARCVLFADGPEGRYFGGDNGSLMHPTLRGDAAEAWRRHHGVQDIDIMTFDPVADGLHLMELQRRQPVGSGIFGHREGQFLIGGHVSLTEVRRDRIDRRTLRTWDEDQRGRRIVPGPMPEIASRVLQIAPAIAQRDGLNRAQRRRLEKEARKGTAR